MPDIARPCVPQSIYGQYIRQVYTLPDIYGADILAIVYTARIYGALVTETTPDTATYQMRKLWGCMQTIYSHKITTSQVRIYLLIHTCSIYAPPGIPHRILSCPVMICAAAGTWGQSDYNISRRRHRSGPDSQVHELDITAA